MGVDCGRPFTIEYPGWVVLGRGRGAWFRIRSNPSPPCVAGRPVAPGAKASGVVGGLLLLRHQFKYRVCILVKLSRFASSCRTAARTADKKMSLGYLRIYLLYLPTYPMLPIGNGTYLPRNRGKSDYLNFYLPTYEVPT